MNSARFFFSAMLFFVGVMAVSPVQAQSAELSGLVTEQEIIQNDRIFKIYVDRYEPDSAAVNYLAELKNPIELVVFMGSWCRESKKYIPGLMKALSEAGSDSVSVRYIAVDAQKKSPQKFLNKFDIKYIPTVVVLKGDKEIGRIVEKPQLPIELELIEILKRGKKSE